MPRTIEERLHDLEQSVQRLEERAGQEANSRRRAGRLRLLLLLIVVAFYALYLKYATSVF